MFSWTGLCVFDFPHSRIEWVWLHWSEFLKAHEEFEGWLSKQRSALDVGTELQLGLKEKVWQVDQQRVVVSDVHSQSLLLERLLDEAAALHSRTQDPSVGAQAQEQLQEAYNTVRDLAEVRGHTGSHPPQCFWSHCSSSRASVEYLVMVFILVKTQHTAHKYMNESLYLIIISCVCIDVAVSGAPAAAAEEGGGAPDVPKPHSKVPVLAAAENQRLG